MPSFGMLGLDRISRQSATDLDTCRSLKLWKAESCKLGSENLLISGTPARDSTKPSLILLHVCDSSKFHPRTNPSTHPQAARVEAVVVINEKESNRVRRRRILPRSSVRNLFRLRNCPFLCATQLMLALHINFSSDFSSGYMPNGLTTDYWTERALS